MFHVVTDQVTGIRHAGIDVEYGTSGQPGKAPPTAQATTPLPPQILDRNFPGPFEVYLSFQTVFQAHSMTPQAASPPHEYFSVDQPEKYLPEGFDNSFPALAPSQIFLDPAPTKISPTPPPFLVSTAAPPLHLSTPKTRECRATRPRPLAAGLSHQCPFNTPRLREHTLLVELFTAVLSAKISMIRTTSSICSRTRSTSRSAHGYQGKGVS